MSVPGFIVPTQIWIFLFFKPELHEVVELSLDVGQDGQTGQVSQTTPLVSQLRRFNNFDLRTDKTKGIKSPMAHCNLQARSQQLNTTTTASEHHP